MQEIKDIDMDELKSLAIDVFVDQDSIDEDIDSKLDSMDSYNLNTNGKSGTPVMMKIHKYNLKSQLKKINLFANRHVDDESVDDDIDINMPIKSSEPRYMFGKSNIIEYKGVD